MIDDAKLALLRGVWWEVTAATIAIFIICLALNLFGDALREIAGLPTKFNLTELLKKPEPKAQAETVLMGVSDPDQAAPPPAKNWFTKLRSTLLRA